MAKAMEKDRKRNGGIQIMVRFAKDAEKVEMTTFEPAEYLFKIVKVAEKVSQAGNDYWGVWFESQEGCKVYDNFMFGGKGATKTLALLTAIGLADGEEFPEDELETDDILGKKLYIEVVKDKDSDYLKCPFNMSKYRPAKTAKKVKKVEADEEIPF